MKSHWWIPALIVLLGACSGGGEDVEEATVIPVAVVLQSPDGEGAKWELALQLPVQLDNAESVTLLMRSTYKALLACDGIDKETSVHLQFDGGALKSAQPGTKNQDSLCIAKELRTQALTISHTDPAKVILAVRVMAQEMTP